VVFEVSEPNVTEVSEGDPSEIVLENARWKASSVAARASEGTLVIAGDTEVALDGVALGQPEDTDEAAGMLRRLSGREHQVFGALALLGPDRIGDRPRAREGRTSSTVRFRKLDEQEIDAYLRSGEWRGRAGAYAIQGLGSALVDEVRGDLSNVIGLPVPLLVELAPELVRPFQRS
jgi:septum formation protein